MAELVRAEWGGRVSAGAHSRRTWRRPARCSAAAGTGPAPRSGSPWPRRWCRGVGRARRGRACGCSAPTSLIHRGEFADAAQVTCEVIEVQWSWWRTSYLADPRRGLRPRRATGCRRGGRARRGEHWRQPLRAGAGDARAGPPHGRRGPDLAAALAEFEAIGCAFQAARTGWMLGGARARRGDADLRAPAGAAADGRARRRLSRRAAQVPARASASRSLRARVWSIVRATSGCSRTNGRNSHAAMPTQRRSVPAVTVADRGPSSSRATSPK